MAATTATTIAAARPSRPIQVVHLSVVHRPDDPRIYERECRTLAQAGYDVTYLAPDADGARDEHGVLRAPLPERPRTTRWMSVYDIVRDLRAWRPDVLHVHDPELLTLFPAARALAPRLVYDMHEYVPEQVAAKHYIPERVRPYASRTTAVAQRGLAALGHGVVVVVDEQLHALGTHPALRAVLPNYPQLGRFAAVTPDPELAADARLKLIYVGSLSRNRGCDLMLDVMERSEPGEAVLYLGGTFASPDLEGEVRARLAAGLADRVRLLGRIPPPELPRYLAAADVVWVPSVPSKQYSHPTIPTKLLEGMAVGLAALVSNLPGRGELVLHARQTYTVHHGPYDLNFFERVPFEDVARTVGAATHGLLAIGPQANITPRFVWHRQLRNGRLASFHGDGLTMKTLRNLQVNRTSVRVIFDLAKLEGYALYGQTEEVGQEEEPEAWRAISAGFAAIGFGRPSKVFRHLSDRILPLALAPG